MIVKLDPDNQHEAVFNVLCDRCREKETIYVCSCSPNSNLERVLTESSRWKRIEINGTLRHFCKEECGNEWIKDVLSQDKGDV